MPTTKIHIDTDIGGDIDDLCALAMVLRWPGVELTGVTTVDGIRFNEFWLDRTCSP